MQMMEFFEESNKAQDIPELLSDLHAALATYGYDRCLCIATDSHRPDVLSVPGAAGRFTQEFVNEYKNNNYSPCDPVLKMLLHIQGPFTWEHVNMMPLGKKQQEVMNLRRELIPGRVLMLPVRHSDPRLVGMGIAGPESEVRMDLEAISQLYAISNQFYSCYAQLKNEVDLQLMEIRLSQREKEILHLCSQGLNNSTIAGMLHISTKTVEFHLSSIFRKLEVNNRTSAALKAANLGLIVTQ